MSLPTITRMSSECTEVTLGTPLKMGGRHVFDISRGDGYYVVAFVKTGIKTGDNFVEDNVMAVYSNALNASCGRNVFSPHFKTKGECLQSFGGIWYY